MIIARSPLRISLGGGGTDLPSYYERFGGFLISAAIDKYIYITVHDTFVPELIVKYSKLERVESMDQVQHPIIREALRLVRESRPDLVFVEFNINDGSPTNEFRKATMDGYAVIADDPSPWREIVGHQTAAAAFQPK